MDHAEASRLPIATDSWDAQPSLRRLLASSAFVFWRDARPTQLRGRAAPVREHFYFRGANPVDGHRQ
jgi:hypothetical protein